MSHSWYGWIIDNNHGIVRLRHIDQKIDRYTTIHKHVHRFLQEKSFNANNIICMVESTYQKESFPYKSFCTIPHRFTVDEALVNPEITFGKLAKGFTDKLNSIERLIGSEDIMLDVIDVKNEEALQMSFKDLQKYFTTKSRKVIYNQVSFEFSHLELGEKVQPPQFVQEIDWINVAWMKKNDDDINNKYYPKIQKYLILSSQGSYMDFHIDLSGSSVWYHVLIGAKLICLVQPTPENLKIYETWLDPTKINDVFFLDLIVDKQTITYVDIQDSQTIIIPSGYIHAVYTYEDSIVFGGNFFHSFGIEMQLNVDEIEDLKLVPLEYRASYFYELNCLAVGYTMDCAEYFLTSNDEINSLKRLITKCQGWITTKNLKTLCLTTICRRHAVHDAADLFDVVSDKLNNVETEVQCTSPLDYKDGDYKRLLLNLYSTVGTIKSMYDDKRIDEIDLSQYLFTFAYTSKYDKKVILYTSIFVCPTTGEYFKSVPFHNSDYGRHAVQKYSHILEGSGYFFNSNRLEKIHREDLLDDYYLFESVREAELSAYAFALDSLNYRLHSSSNVIYAKFTIATEIYSFENGIYEFHDKSFVQCDWLRLKPDCKFENFRLNIRVGNVWCNKISYDLMVATCREICDLMNRKYLSDVRSFVIDENKKKRLICPPEFYLTFPISGNFHENMVHDLPLVENNAVDKSSVDISLCMRSKETNNPNTILEANDLRVLCMQDEFDCFNDSLMHYWLSWILRYEIKTHLNIYTCHPSLYRKLIGDNDARPQLGYIGRVDNSDTSKSRDLFFYKMILFPMCIQRHWVLVIILNPRKYFPKDNLNPKGDDDFSIIICDSFYDKPNPNIENHHKFIIKVVLFWLRNEYYFYHPDMFRYELNGPQSRNDYLKGTLKDPPIPERCLGKYKLRKFLSNGGSDLSNCGMFVCAYAAQAVLWYYEKRVKNIDSLIKDYLSITDPFYADQLRNEFIILLLRLEKLHYVNLPEHEPNENDVINNCDDEKEACNEVLNNCDDSSVQELTFDQVCRQRNLEFELIQSDDESSMDDDEIASDIDFKNDMFDIDDVFSGIEYKKHAAPKESSLESSLVKRHKDFHDEKLLSSEVDLQEISIIRVTLIIFSNTDEIYKLLNDDENNSMIHVLNKNNINYKYNWHISVTSGDIVSETYYSHISEINLEQIVGPVELINYKEKALSFFVKSYDELNNNVLVGDDVNDHEYSYFFPFRGKCLVPNTYYFNTKQKKYRISSELCTFNKYIYNYEKKIYYGIRLIANKYTICSDLPESWMKMHFDDVFLQSIMNSTLHNNKKLFKRFPGDIIPKPIELVHTHNPAIEYPYEDYDTMAFCTVASVLHYFDLEDLSKHVYKQKQKYVDHLYFHRNISETRRNLIRDQYTNEDEKKSYHQYFLTMHDPVAFINEVIIHQNDYICTKINQLQDIEEEYKKLRDGEFIFLVLKSNRHIICLTQHYIFDCNFRNIINLSNDALHKLSFGWFEGISFGRVYRKETKKGDSNEKKGDSNEIIPKKKKQRKKKSKNKNVIESEKIELNKGCVHIPKGKSNGCLRSKAAAGIFFKRMMNMQSVRFKHRRIYTQQCNKWKRLALLDDASPQPYLKEEDINKMQYFFYNFSDDPILNKIANEYENYALIKISKTNFNIINTTDGIKLLEDETNCPVFILPPRKEIAKQKFKASRDIQVLRKLLSNFKLSTKRGRKRQGVSTHYATLGTHCNRFKRGVSDKLLDELEYKEELKHLKKIMNKIFNLARMFLPPGMLSSLQIAKELCKDNNIFVDIPKNHSLHSTIWSSLASSFNYVAPAHTDEDSFLSALFVCWISKNKEHLRCVYYDEDPEVAVYLCFPTLGICIGLRPGDVIFFNPLYPHCISQRLDYYKKDDVFVTSFYLKNKQLSRNDNSLIISDECLFYADYLKEYINNTASK